MENEKIRQIREKYKYGHLIFKIKTVANCDTATYSHIQVDFPPIFLSRSIFQSDAFCPPLLFVLLFIFSVEKTAHGLMDYIVTLYGKSAEPEFIVQKHVLTGT